MTKHQVIEELYEGKLSRTVLKTNGVRESIIEFNRVHSVLGNIPTVILYSDINDYQVNFHFAFWGIENKEISLFSLAPWNWEEVYLTLKENGATDKEALREIRKVIVMVYQLISGFLADWHYLQINPLYQPQLFTLKSEFPQEWVTPYIKQLQQSYDFNQVYVTYEKGLWLFNSQLYKEAIKSFDAVLLIKPKSTEAWYYRGLALFELKEYREAQESLTKVLEINPNHELAYYQQGIIFFRLKESEKALESFNKALAINPHNKQVSQQKKHILEELKPVKDKPDNNLIEVSGNVIKTGEEVVKNVMEVPGNVIKTGEEVIKNVLDRLPFPKFNNSSNKTEK